MTQGEFITGLGARNDVVRVVPGVDVTRLPITAEEGYLFSRVEGCASVGELLMVCGLAEAEAVAGLIHLVELGAVEGPSEAGVVDASTRSFERFEFDPGLLAEAGDLDLETKKELLFREAMGPQWHHYDALGVRPTDPPERIQEAYISFVRRLHPDRFFGKSLGSYKARIEQVVRRIREAYEVLSSPESKAAYDKITEVAPTREELAAIEADQTKIRRERRKKSERRERLLRRTPMAGQKKKATEFAEEARKMAAREDWRQAANLYRLALSFDPENEALEELLEESVSLSASSRCLEYLEKARSAAALGRPEEAGEFHQQAVDTDPSNAEALFAHIKYLFATGRDPSSLIGMAQKVTYLDRHNVEAWTFYGKLLASQGEKAKARKALERAVDLDEMADEAKEALKQLRWKLF